MDLRYGNQLCAQRKGDRVEAAFWEFLVEPSSANLLEKMLQACTERQRKVIELRWIGSAMGSMKEASVQMAVSRTTVDIHQKNALRRMFPVFACEFGHQYPESELLQCSLYVLGIRTSTLLRLERAGIHRVADLVSKSPNELCQIAHFEKRHMQDVRQKLAGKDLKLCGDYRRLVVDEA